MWTLTPHDIERDRLGKLLRSPDPATIDAAKKEIMEQFGAAEAPLISELRLAGNEITSLSQGFQTINNPQLTSEILIKYLNDQKFPLRIKYWILYSSMNKKFAPYMLIYLIDKYQRVNEWQFDHELPIALANAIAGMSSKTDILSLKNLLINPTIGDTRSIIVKKFKAKIKKDMPDLLEGLRAQGGSVASALK